jgi:preprotein translocase subunit Sec61beta
MSGTNDTNEPAEADQGGLDPREAARLLSQSEREARRQFNLSPQWVNVVMAFVILLAYGSLWLSTRGQHPYQGPSLGVVALVYGAVAVAIAVAVKVYRRATAGVSGPPVRQQQAEGVAILVSFVLGSPVLQGALKHYDAGNAIVYGVIPAAAPLIVVGTTALGIAASKADWRQFGASLAVVIAGGVAAFSGPSGAWLAAGIGLFIAIVGYAAADALWHRPVPLQA